MNDLFTIGSVVKLDKESASKIMIVGHNIHNKKDDQVYQYAGVLLPAGIPETNSFLLFNQDDVQQVLYIGYQTD